MQSSYPASFPRLIRNFPGLLYFLSPFSLEVRVVEQIFQSQSIWNDRWLTSASSHRIRQKTRICVVISHQHPSTELLFPVVLLTITQHFWLISSLALFNVFFCILVLSASILRTTQGFQRRKNSHEKQSLMWLSNWGYHPVFSVSISEDVSPTALGPEHLNIHLPELIDVIESSICYKAILRFIFFFNAVIPVLVWTSCSQT